MKIGVGAGTTANLSKSWVELAERNPTSGPTAAAGPHAV